MRIFFVLLAIAACSPNVESRGHVREMESLSQVRVGESTREEVMGLFGSPSSTSAFGGETWYYITEKKESFAFFRPEVVDQEVVRIVFGVEGKVSSVEKFDKSAMQTVAFNPNQTPTEGQELTFIEQLLGNTGRFNSPGSAPGQTGGSGQRGRR